MDQAAGVVVHCQGFAQRIDASHAPSLDLAAIRAAAGAVPLDPERCHEALEAAGVRHGAAFRCLTHLTYGAGQVLAEMRLPAAAPAASGLALHPGLMDAALQAVVGLDLGAGAVVQPALPFSLDRIDIFGPTQPQMWAWVRPSGEPVSAGSTVRETSSVTFENQAKGFEKPVFGNTVDKGRASGLTGPAQPSGDDASPGNAGTVEGSASTGFQPETKVLGRSGNSAIRKHDIDLCDAQGRVRVAMRGFATRPATPTSRIERRQSTAPARELLLAPVWTAIADNRLAFDAGLAQPQVVVGADAPLRTALAQRFPNLIFLDGDLEVCRAWLRDAGPIRHLLWVAPPEPARNCGDADLVSAQERGALHLFHLIKALLDAGHGSSRLVLTALTFASQSVNGRDAVDPSHAAVHGMLGSIAKEMPQWTLRPFDLESRAGLPLDPLFSLAAEPNGNGLAHRGGQWFRLDLLPVTPPEPGQPPVYREGGVYVVIGGAGGIGAAWTRHLVQHYHARVIWIGRRPADAAIDASLRELAALGPAPHYISADAADRQALERACREIVHRFGAVHGLVHSAIVLRDRGIAGMSEADFRAGLAAKVDTCVHMAAAFADQPLDFVLFFSSIISWTKAPCQSNYAGGSTFADAFAARLRQERESAVKVMNWGWWGNTGIVASDDYRSRMHRAGLASIEPDEGMGALDLLLAGPLDQLALVKTLRDGVLDDVQADQRLTSCPPRRDSVAAVLREQAASRVAGVAVPDAAVSWWNADLEAALGRLLFAQLQDLGLFAQPEFDLAARKQALGWRDLYDRWFVESLAFLAKADLVTELGGDRYRVKAEPVDVAAVWARWDRQKAQWLDNPQLAALTLLVERTLQALPDILTGRVAATDVVFPNASHELVEGIYRGNPVADYFNRVLTGQIVTWLEATLVRDPGAAIRILEIGAGTGGTTAWILPELDRCGSHIAEYRFTDLSHSFLIRARKTFGADRAYFTTAPFDVSRCPAGQDLDVGGYDLVIATNVLHATADIRETLRHTKALLAENGVLMVNEMSCNPLCGHLTFGLLEGWWLVADPSLRLPGSPGLAPEMWRRLLVEEGFREPLFPVSAAHHLGNQLILAESDGLVRVTLAAAKPASITPVAGPAPVSAEPAAPRSIGIEIDIDAVLRAKTTDLVKGLVADTLEIPRGRINGATPLEKYGIDSILVIQLTRALGEVFEDITNTLFFEFQTIDALVDHFVQTRRDELIRVVGLPQPAPASASIAPPMAVPVAPPVAQVRPPAGPRFRDAAEPAKRPSAADPVRGRDVAVIGLAGRYPGAADPAAFWRNLRDGVNSVTEIPAERWNWADFYDEEKGKRGRMYSKWGGFLDDVDAFDPLFFQISPRDAERMDPQERLFLETAWQVMEDAGYTPANLCRRGDGRRDVGVFVGVMNGTYNRPASFSSIANRVSYTFDFQGPSLVVDTACSASLTAIHLALESLHGGTCGLAIAGGVNCILDPAHFLSLSELTVLSPGNACKSFGSGADGIVDGEGVGAVLLKPLAQAVADGDRIYGVIKGSMINAGGKTNGYTVPNPRAQADLVRDALRRADVDARTIGYLEAHGTGTILGDPIEIAGLTRAFESFTRERGFCAIGSAKSNIGHCESAAGIAGLTKILLQLRHRTIAPTLHAETLNPGIDFDRTPFVVNRAARAWTPRHIDGVAVPRRAGISSFGAGGANAHLIVEEHQVEPMPAPAETETHPPAIVVLSARNRDRLREVVARQLAFVERAQGAERDPAASESCGAQMHDGSEDLGPRLINLLAVELGLATDQVTRDESLGEYGMDRVQRTRFMVRLQDALSLELDPATFLALDSLAEIEAHLRRLQPGMGSGSAGPEPVEMRGDVNLLDLAYTLQVGRVAMPARFGVTVNSLEELVDRLRGYLAAAAGGDLAGEEPAEHLADTLAVLAADEDVAGLGELWFRKGKYDKLLDFWCKGLDVDWRRLYDEGYAGTRRPRRIGLPTYPFARERFWRPAAPTQPARRTEPARRLSRLLEMTWADASPAVASSVSDGAVILATRAVLGLAEAVAGRLNEARICCVDDVPSRAAALEEPCKLWIDLTGCDPAQANALGWFEWVRQRIDRGAGGALLLGVTRGLGEDPAAGGRGALQACLYAMLQSEYGALRSRHLDLAPGADTDTAARWIAAECAAQDAFTHVRYRDGRRQGAMLRERPPASQPVARISFPEDRVLWITGGTRGLGALCARHFVTHYGVKRLVLTGRQALPPRDQWEGELDPGVAGKIRTIRELEAAGACVEVLSFDIADRVALQGHRDRVRADLGPIGGLIHCAGTGDPANPALVRKTEASVARVLAPKVAGLEALFAVFGAEPLRFFLNFSSVSGIVPSLAVGHGDYAMANAFMDAFARAHHETAPLVSIQWPSWKESGVGEIHSAAYRATGMLSHTDAEGLALLDRILAERIGPVVLPAVVDPNRWRPERLLEARLGGDGVDGTGRREDVRRAAEPTGHDATLGSWGTSNRAPSVGDWDRVRRAAEPTGRDATLGSWGTSNWAPSEGDGDRVRRAAEPTGPGATLGSGGTSNWAPSVGDGDRVRRAAEPTGRDATLGSWGTPDRAPSVGDGDRVRRAAEPTGHDATQGSWGTSNWAPSEGDGDRVRRAAEPTGRDATQGSSGTSNVGASGAVSGRGDLLAATRRWLTSLFCAELKLDAAELGPRTPFPEVGVDSILLAQVAKDLNRALGRELDPSLMFEVNTIRDLSAWLLDHFEAELRTALDAATPSRDAALPVGAEAQLAALSSGPPALKAEVQPVPAPAPATSTAAERGHRDIAVIGLSCRFPGAPSPEAYWQLLCRGECAIAPVPAARWGYESDFQAGMIEDIHRFDTDTFLIPEKDAAAMDPQALVVLEESLKLLYRSGYTPDEVKGRPLGVYLGARSQHLPEDRRLHEAVNPIVAIGQNYLAANISQFFDLRGPSLVLDTACSSALVAMNGAIGDLQRGEVEAALVGGISLLTGDRAHRLFHQRGILSPDAAFHVFDQRAQGVVLGEGVGLVMLKTLDAALRDGDAIHAVVRGLAINNDGRTAGPASPNPEAQKAVMRQALAKSGHGPGDIGYIEVNGSGSHITDLLELKAVDAIYGRDRRTSCGLGSMKPNIGHPLCAEGIAGFIKVVLMLRNRRLVPFLSGKQPLKHFDLAQSPFTFPRKAEPWSDPLPVAAINCFADGGTNAHVILQPMIDPAAPRATRQALPLPQLNRRAVQSEPPRPSHSDGAEPGAATATSIERETIAETGGLRESADTGRPTIGPPTSERSTTPGSVPARANFWRRSQVSQPQKARE